MLLGLIIYICAKNRRAMKLTARRLKGEKRGFT